MDFVKTRRIQVAVILALAWLSAGAAAQLVTKSQRVIRVVVDNDYAPYSFLSDEGKLQGIVIDQWKAWEKKTGMKAEIHAMDWAEALSAMRAGDFDVIDCIVATSRRRDDFDFTPAYATVDASIFFRNDVSGITNQASLRGFPVGIKAGDQHLEKLIESGVTTAMPFRNNAEIVQAAKQHKINVFVMDVPSALYLLNKLGVANDFRRSTPIFRDQLRRAVRKKDAKLLTTVSSGFAAIPPAELKRIDEEWFGRTINRHEPYFIYAGYAAAAALVLIAVLIGWNRTLRKRILQRTSALAESEQRFRQIAENTHEVFWLFSLDSGKTIYVSPAYEALWGVPSEILYHDARSFITSIHPEDRARVIEAIDRDRERGFEIEYRIVRPDGSIRWIWDRGFPIKDEAGRVYRLAGIAEDITDRKLASEAMKQAEDRIRLNIDTIPTMVWSLRSDGVLDFVNQRWLDYTGLSFEDAMNQPNGIVHPDDLPRVLERWLTDMAAGGPSEEEMRLRRADGEYRWFLVRTVPLLDGNGEIIKWYGASTDLEDRKRAEENLRRSESKLAEAQRISHVGHWERDTEGGEIICSVETYRILGLPPQDAIRNLEELIHPEDRPLHAEAIARAMRGELFDVEYRVVRPNGEVRFVHSQGSAIQDQSGRAHRTFGAVQDVTEIKLAEERLKATSEQLRALSARLQSAREEEGMRIAREIHDELGAPLTGLRWELEGIKKILSEPGKGLPSADLKSRLATMFGLIDTMVSIVRGIASDLRPAVLDVLGLGEAIAWQAQQFQDRTGITVDYASPADEIGLTPEQSIAVFRIFQEALTNVLRHARATRVDVTMSGEDELFVLTVKDDGRGITEDEKHGQSSIGLLGMRERAHLLGGEVDITRNEGEGTSVTVRLPIVCAWLLPHSSDGDAPVY
ncbi:MAG TPA: PAS domain-containing protein [Thermoanaerobaculia bacterium]|jgi:PAS domain S-box-containing protein|nr:PAS domain-containing protein [Thermoanaerobaculia bacterium]